MDVAIANFEPDSTDKLKEAVKPVDLNTQESKISSKSGTYESSQPNEVSDISSAGFSESKHDKASAEPMITGSATKVVGPDGSGAISKGASVPAMRNKSGPKVTTALKATQPTLKALSSQSIEVDNGLSNYHFKAVDKDDLRVSEVEAESFDKEISAIKLHAEDSVHNLARNVDLSVDEVDTTDIDNEVVLTESKDSIIREGDLNETILNEKLGAVIQESSEDKIPQTPEEITRSLELETNDNIYHQITSDKSSIAPEIALKSVKQDEIPTPIEKIEDTLDEITEKINDLAMEGKEELHEILDEIAAKVQDVQSSNEISHKEQAEVLKSTISTEEVEKAIKELFIQLFENVEIEYTEELVDSFAKLALKVDILELILETEQEVSAAAQGQGTHEVIIKLLKAVTDLKKKLFHAYQLGKSAINLYFKQPTTT